MRRRLIMILLGFGVVAGYGSGFAHIHQCARWHQAQRDAAVAQFADRCAEAAIQQRMPMMAPQGNGPTIITIGVPATISH